MQNRKVMKDWTDYDWTPEERAAINGDRELLVAVQTYLNMGWFDRRKCMLIFGWMRFNNWIKKFEKSILAVLWVTVILLAALTIYGVIQAR